MRQPVVYSQHVHPQNKSAVMKLLIALGLLIFTVGIAAADDDSRTEAAVEGAYLMLQTNDVQRVIAFTACGTVSIVGSGGQNRGYTSGLGAWEQTGRNQVTARIVDFNFDPDTGTPLGSALVTYTLNFEDLEDGAFQRLSGRFAGEQFAVGQNPLDPTEDPVRTFGRELTGQRILAR